MVDDALISFCVPSPGIGTSGLPTYINALRREMRCGALHCDAPFPIMAQASSPPTIIITTVFRSARRNSMAQKNEQVN